MGGEIQMFDSIDISQLPRGAPAYAGYVDGHWPTYPKLKAMFPRAHVLSIAVFPSGNAECLDIEPGAATIAQAYPWFERQLARGAEIPTLYSSAANVNLIIGSMESRRVRRKSYRIWSAHYTGTKHICGPATCAYRDASGHVIADCDGTQWTNRALGQNLDESLLVQGFFGPVSTPRPRSQQEDIGMLLLSGTMAITPIAIAKGSQSWIAFGSDNSLAKEPAPSLRVAMHSHTSGWSQVEHIRLPNSGKHTVRFREKDVNLISVRREGQGDHVPVAYNMG